MKLSIIRFSRVMFLIFGLPCLSLGEELYYEMVPGNMPKRADITIGSDFGEYEHYRQFVDFNGDGIIDAISRCFHFYAHAGGSHGELYFYRGDTNGHFTFVDQLPNPSRSVPNIDFTVGDWNNDGKEDLLLMNENTNSFYVTWFWEKDHWVSIPVSNQEVNYISYWDISCQGVGDFDGDGNQDLCVPNTLFDQHSSFLFWGDGSGKFVYQSLSQIPHTKLFAVSDLNQDGLDDICCIYPKNLSVFFGNADRSHIFTTTGELQLGFDPAYVFPIDINNDQIKEIYIADNQNSAFIAFNAKTNQLYAINLTLPNEIGPTNIHFADLDHNGLMDILSWIGTTLRIDLQESLGHFTFAKTIPIPGIHGIETVYSWDMNQDGRRDLLVFPQEDISITLFNRSQPPTPTPTPLGPAPTLTPTSTPMPPATPTATPYPVESGSMMVSSAANLNTLFKETVDGSMLFFLPGEYPPPNEFPYIINIENKILSLVGTDPNYPAVLYPPVNITNSKMFLQNLYIPARDGKNCVYITNSNLIIINCKLFGSSDFSAWGGIYHPGQSPLLLSGCTDKRVELIDCRFYPKYKDPRNPILFPSIQIDNCNGLTLDLRQNPVLNDDITISRIRIAQSQKVTILLPPSITIIANLYITDSTVTLMEGNLQGSYGKSGVIGENGQPAINALSNSTVYLSNVTLYGGRGGDGIIPGKDAPPFEKDDTSIVQWITSIDDWDLY